MSNISLLKSPLNSNSNNGDNINLQLYALDDPENIKQKIMYSETDILVKYNVLVVEYLNYIIDNIASCSVKEMNYNKYIIMRGFETISHVFSILLNYTKNLEMTYYHSQKAYYYYVEFIGQITNYQESFLQLNSRDACMYVYKKTIFELNNGIRQNMKSCIEFEKCSKKLSIIKQTIFYCIRHFDFIFDKKILLKHIDILCVKLVHVKLNPLALGFIESLICKLDEKNNYDCEYYFHNIFLFINKLLKYKNIENKETQIQQIIDSLSTDLFSTILQQKW